MVLWIQFNLITPFIFLESNAKKDVEMAEIMGTVTSIKRYLSPEKIELKISPDMVSQWSSLFKACGIPF